MIVEHLDLLIQARTHLAALADTSPPGADYDGLLLDLDDLRPDVPATAINSPDGQDRAHWYEVARAAMTSLRDHGIDALELAVLLARLDDTWAADGGARP
jgi:hypothetical protein